MANSQQSQKDFQSQDSSSLCTHGFEVKAIKIYTKRGDQGQTDTLGQGRRSKNDGLFDLLGDLDELNALLGLAGKEADRRDLLIQKQSELLSLGAEIASESKDDRFLWVQIGESVAEMESQIDEMDASLAPLTAFILPGGSTPAAHLHLARAICRRAERSAVTYSSGLRDEVIQWLNRFSDWLFTLARHENKVRNIADITWKQE